MIVVELLQPTPLFSALVLLPKWRSVKWRMV
ncbi:hypothetical protein LINPERHAP1_LOCUS36499 [Linum perenne]